jgi:hypothetical protein
MGSLSGRLGLLAALWWGLGPGSAACRADSPVYYFANRTFALPFELIPGRPIRQVLLHASSDGKTYRPVATAIPSAQQFVYTAGGDGWFYFVVQEEDLEGRFTPANVSLARASVRVCVDTVKPVATLKPVAPQDGGTVAVEWEVSDAHLDLKTLKLQYAIQGSDRWVTLNIRQMEHAQFSWRPVGAGPFDVRVQVSDLAGNVATATTRVTPGAAAPAGGGASAGYGNARVIHVPRKTFKLNYKLDNIGPSKVKHVEVWWTRDTHMMWNLWETKAQPTGPFEITVPLTGRYGFTLRPISGVGRGPKPPALHEQPQLWVVVDESKPTVVLQSVVVGDKADNGFITVNYVARDEHLKANPITIKYAEKPDGPWTDLQANLENTGTCKCNVKELSATLFEFYIRVEAIDEAGNVGFAQTKETVKVDLNTPRVSEVNVNVDAGAEAAPKPPG